MEGQTSLRDGRCLDEVRGLKSSGYQQSSLRDGAPSFELGVVQPNIGEAIFPTVSSLVVGKVLWLVCSPGALLLFEASA